MITMTKFLVELYKVNFPENAIHSRPWKLIMGILYWVLWTWSLVFVIYLVKIYWIVYQRQEICGKRFAMTAFFSSVQSLSCVRLFVTPWITARQASLSITNSWSLLKLMPIESVMPSILCSPLLLLPPILPSTRVFSNESTLHMRLPKFLSFSFNISLSSEHPGLISFRMDWLDLLAVQGTPKSVLQYHSSKASIFWHSTFFIIQLSHPYMTIGKNITLTRWIFVSEVMSLL